ncbi:hypothetical protein DFJ73DRAFT_861086 [Zopfochytrium polystomum]|nr:hypothetical protein DFJ73DRAFT_861086 [Zopfochytrium polystomum]
MHAPSHESDRYVLLALPDDPHDAVSTESEVAARRATYSLPQATTPAIPSTSRSTATDPLPFPPPGWKVTQLSAGESHTLAVLETTSIDFHDPQLWFAGDSSRGQSGSVIPPTPGADLDLDFMQLNWRSLLAQALNGEQLTATHRLRLKAIGCGRWCSFVVLEDGSSEGSSKGESDDLLLALGDRNDFGELGCGEFHEPAPASPYHARLIDLRRAFAGPRLGRLRVHSVAAGLHHTLVHCSLGDRGARHAVIGWGDNRHRQLELAAVRGSVLSAALNGIFWTPQVILEFTEADQCAVDVTIAAGHQHSAIYFRNGPPAGLSQQFLLLGDNWTEECLAIIKSKSNELLQLGFGSGAEVVLLVGNARTRSSTVFVIGPTDERAACFNAGGGQVEQLAFGIDGISGIASHQGAERERLILRRRVLEGKEASDVGFSTSPPPDSPGSISAIFSQHGRALLQMRLDVSPPSPEQTLELCRRLPKVELHAHLNGSIRRSTLSELAKRCGLDDKAAHVVENDARTLSEMFAVFDVIHKVVRGKETIRRVVREVLEDMEADGVAYAEIRTTPKAQPDYGLNEEGYCNAVLSGMEEYAESRSGLASRTIARLLLSIDRRGGPEAAERTVDLAVALRARGVVGIDLSGDPTKGTWSDWKPALSRARSAGLRTTLHAGEVPNTDGEMSAMLDFRPDRMGHVCFISLENERRLRRSGIPVELCLTSNLLSRSVERYDLHHFDDYRQRFLRREAARFSICTDDSAVFGSALSEEFAVIKRE